MDKFMEKLDHIQLDKRLKEFFNIVYTYHKDKELEPFYNVADQISDRESAIISACMLDRHLERLIRSFYIKDARVTPIFRDEHIKWLLIGIIY